MRPRALIFDIDGTIIVSDPVHAEIFRDMFRDRGREVGTEFYYREVHGRETEAVFAEAFPDADAGRLADDKEATFRARLAEEGAPAVEGLHGILDRAEAAGLRLGAVTNAPRANAEAMIEAVGATGRFAFVVSGAECERGKPDPLPYEEALRHLGLTADEVVAFEDSGSGVASAAGAGLTVIGVRSSLDDAALREAGAAETIADFTDPRLAAIFERGTP